VGEVEVALKNLPGIEDAVVVTQSRAGEHYLVAYVVSNTQQQASIQSQLKQILPYYMIPASIVNMEILPLNANGKVDIRALPEVQVTNQQAFVAPASEIEKRLAALWSDVLSLSEVSTQSSFFELGGHSILAMKLIPMMLNEFDVAISVADLFNYSTIAEQAELIQLLAQHAQTQGHQIEQSSEELEELEW